MFSNIQYSILRQDLTLLTHFFFSFVVILNVEHFQIPKVSLREKPGEICGVMY